MTFSEPLGKSDLNPHRFDSKGHILKQYQGHLVDCLVESWYPGGGGRLWVGRRVVNVLISSRELDVNGSDAI